MPKGEGRPMRRVAVAVWSLFPAGRKELSVTRFASHLVAVAIVSVVSFIAPASARTLPGHLLPAKATWGATPYAPTSDTIPINVRLQMRNEAGLKNLLTRLYTPGDPAYGKYLT